MQGYRDFVDDHLTVISWSGDEAYCLCPFHEDSNPSFALNINTGLWICHACGEKGNIKQLATRLDADKPEAAIESVMALLAGLKATPEPETVDRYPEVWLEQFDFEDDDYWRVQRCLGHRTINQFRLGYDPLTDSATIPLRDIDKRLLGVVRRRTNPSARPRYIYPKGFSASAHLYGAWGIDQMGMKIALVEGPIDALSCWDAGFPGLALYGSHISPMQVRLLHRLCVREVVIMTDADAAGFKARSEIVDRVHGIQLSLPLDWPEGAKDPNDLNGSQLRMVFNNAEPVWRSRLTGLAPV